MTQAGIATKFRSLAPQDFLVARQRCGIVGEKFGSEEKLRNTDPQEPRAQDQPRAFEREVRAIALQECPVESTNETVERTKRVLAEFENAMLSKEETFLRGGVVLVALDRTRLRKDRQP